MFKTSFRCVLAMAAAAVLPTSLRAADVDTVTVRDGKNVVGDISGTTKTEIAISALAGTKREDQTIPANDVLAVEWKGEPLTMRVSRASEKSGQLQVALTGYQKNLTEATEANIKTDLQFLIARTLAKLALADPARRHEAVKALDGFIAQNANNFRYFEAVALLGDVYLAQQNYPQATAMFDQLKQAPWNDTKMAAQIGTGRVALAQEQPEQALAAFDAVAQMPAETTADKARHQEALLGKASVFREQNRPAEATEVIDQVIQETDATNARTLAEAYNLKGDSLQAEGKTKDALMAYLHVDVLFSEVADQHAKALTNIAALWEKEGRPDRAGDARARYEERFAKTGGGK